jgi:cell division protein FtsQ
LIAALAATGCFLLLDSPLFEVRKVTITGISRIAEEEIIELAGLGAGMSTWQLSLGRVRRMIEAHPRVLRARVSRDLPSGIVIAVVERPVAALLPYYASFLEVDEQGRVLGLAETLPMVPVITGVEVGRALPGDDVSDRLETALILLAYVGKDRDLLAEIHLAAGGEVVVYTARGTAAYFGSPEAMAAKVSALRAVVDELAAKGQRAEYIDLRHPARPRVKLAD